LVKRTSKKKRATPERPIPIVDEVVEVVFARLKDASTQRRVVRGRGLAEALADLVLAHLTRPPKGPKKPKKSAAKSSKKPKRSAAKSTRERQQKRRSS